jgi:hypothetical protein
LSRALQAAADTSRNAWTALASGLDSWTSTWPSEGELDIDVRAGLVSGPGSWTSTWPSVDRNRSAPGAPATAGRHERVLRALRMARARRLARGLIAPASRAP